MGMGIQKNQVTVIRAARGSLKRKPGDKSFAEAWSEHKREEICFSKRLYKETDTANETIRWPTSFEGARLLLPKKFAPDTEFLKRHAEKCVAKQSHKGISECSIELSHRITCQSN